MASQRYELLKNISDTLNRELAELNFPTRIQEQFAFLQIKQISHLADSFLILSQHQKMEAIGCLLRPLIEGFLNLRASLQEPTFAASKSASDLNKFIRHLERLRDNCAPGPAKDKFAEVIKANTVTLGNLMQHHSVTVRNWNAREIAEKGGCVPLYENAYPFFHPSVHAGIDGILPQTSGLYDELAFDLAIAILIDSALIAIQHFVPSKLPAYEIKLKGWVEDREKLSAGP